MGWGSSWSRLLHVFSLNASHPFFIYLIFLCFGAGQVAHLPLPAGAGEGGLLTWASWWRGRARGGCSAGQRPPPRSPQGASGAPSGESQSPCADGFNPCSAWVVTKPPGCRHRGGWVAQRGEQRALIQGSCWAALCFVAFLRTNDVLGSLPYGLVQIWVGNRGQADAGTLITERRSVCMGKCKWEGVARRRTCATTPNHAGAPPPPALLTLLWVQREFGQGRGLLLRDPASRIPGGSPRGCVLSAEAEFHPALERG